MKNNLRKRRYVGKSGTSFNLAPVSLSINIFDVTFTLNDGTQKLYKKSNNEAE